MIDSTPSMTHHERPPRRVFVHGLEVMASVGIFEVEKRYEQRIIVGLDLDVAETYDGVSERIGDVVDYARVASDVISLCQSRHFKLLETLAEAIAANVLRDRRVLGVGVRIEKPDAMPECHSLGIEIRRTAANVVRAGT
jgi:7,8-dihydroneopterin aldolase/epimerase/oxygenase